MKRAIAFLFAAAGLYAQPYAPAASATMVSWCAARPDFTTNQAANLAVFDSASLIGCNNYSTKPAYPTQVRWGIFSTNGGTPSNSSDAGVSKTDLITPARVAAGGIIPDDSSCGNPTILPNGALVFQCQRAAQVSQNIDPGIGSGYDLYACKATFCSTTNAAVIYSQAVVRALCSAWPSGPCESTSGYNWSTMVMSGGLDPHWLHSDQNTLYWSVIEFSQSTPAWCTWGNECIPQSWAIHVFTVDWTGTAPALTGIRYRLGRQTAWSTYAGGLSTQCTKYFKASGDTTDASGNITIYTQAAFVTKGGSTNLQPYLDPGNTGVAPGCIGTNCQNPCYAIGATYRQSGNFSVTLNGTDAGSNWTQLFPMSWQTPSLINGEYCCYGEFPLILIGQDPTKQNAISTKMLMISNSYSATFGGQQDENEANHHDDYYVLDPVQNTLQALTNADTPGSAWNTLLKNGGSFLGMAHGGFNPYGSFMVTRVVNGTGTGQWVIKIPLNYTDNPVLKGASFSGKVSLTDKVALP